MVIVLLTLQRTYHVYGLNDMLQQAALSLMSDTHVDMSMHHVVSRHHVDLMLKHSVTDVP